MLPDSVVHGAAERRAGDSTPPADLVGRVYTNLLRGIALSPAGQAKARA